MVKKEDPRERLDSLLNNYDQQRRDVQVVHTGMGPKALAKLIGHRFELRDGKPVVVTQLLYRGRTLLADGTDDKKPRRRPRPTRPGVNGQTSFV